MPHYSVRLLWYSCPHLYEHCGCGGIVSFEKESDSGLTQESSALPHPAAEGRREASQRSVRVDC